MEARAVAEDAPTIAVAKRDLVEAWSVIERLAVSLHRIGSRFAIPQGQKEQTPEQRQGELEALDQLFSSDVCRELSHARRVLGQYVPDEEAEYLSDNVIQYWTSRGFAPGTPPKE